MTGTCVGAGLIDAHAGGLGLLACTAPEISPSFDTKIGDLFVTVAILFLRNFSGVLTKKFHHRFNLRYIDMPYGSKQVFKTRAWYLGPLL